MALVQEILGKEKHKFIRMWWQKCEHLPIHEDQQKAKDAKIQALKVELIRLQLSHKPSLKKIKIDNA